MARLFAAILCFLSLAATTQPDNDNSADSLPALKAEIRRMNADWASLPLLQVKSLVDVVRFHWMNDFLLVDSPVYAGRTAAYQIQIVGHDGLGILRVNVSRLPGVYYTQFRYYDLAVPGAVEENLQLTGLPAKVIVFCDLVHSDETSTITLDESTDPGADAPVVLRVQNDWSAIGQRVTHETYLGDSMSDLRRKHPAEFERYLRPVMRAFQQEQVGFYVNDRTAWQVLSDSWVAPSDLAGKVDPIVGQLNSDDYSQRAAAQRDLEQIGEPAALYLLSEPHPVLSAEQAARLNKFLAPYRPMDDQMLARFRKDPNFLLDILYNDNHDLRAAALEHLKRLTGRDIEFNLDLTGDQRVAAVTKLREQLAPATQPAAN
jgi:hypothetical protein